MPRTNRTQDNEDRAPRAGRSSHHWLPEEGGPCFDDKTRGRGWIGQEEASCGFRAQVCPGSTEFKPCNSIHYTRLFLAQSGFQLRSE